MKRAETIAVFLLSFSALPSCAQNTVPDEVEAFIARREACDHYRGEIPDAPSADEMRRIEAALEIYCTGTDADLKRLMSKYERRSDIVARLSAFEPSIEAPRESPDLSQRSSDASGHTLVPAAGVPAGSKTRWAGYYMTESRRCTSPIDGSTCATEFHDCLRVKSTPSGYLVELMSTQANQHVCAFSIEMNEVGDQLTYESPLGQVLLRNTGSRLVIESDGIDPTASGLGFCGSHADINSLAFPTIDVSRTDAQCFDAESMR